MVSVSVAEPASFDSDRETLQPVPARDGLRVWLVDHDADARDVAAVLADCGAKVVAVGCGTDALQALKNEAPHVLVSDIAMPGMDGHALMRTIRELGGRHESVPAFALTGTPHWRPAHRPSWPATRSSCPSRSIRRNSSRSGEAR